MTIASTALVRGEWRRTLRLYTSQRFMTLFPP
jgi:hypothetical protein